MEGPWASITKKKIPTICTNDAQVTIIFSRILTTFRERYSQFMEWDSIRSVNMCITAKKNTEKTITKLTNLSQGKNIINRAENISTNTYGFLRDDQPAWASNCEGLTYMLYFKKSTSLIVRMKNNEIPAATGSTSLLQQWQIIPEPFL